MLQIKKAVTAAIEYGKTRKSKFLLAVLLLVVMGTVFLQYIWLNSIAETKAKAVELAMAAGTLIPKEYVAKLEGDPSDLDKNEYQEIKDGLIKLSTLHEDVHFIYILGEKNNKAIILADSEPVGSAAYALPGQEMAGAGEEASMVFQTGETLISKPFRDRDGYMIRILVPMKEAGAAQVMAVFGVDYPVAEWGRFAAGRTIQASVVIVCLFAILVLFRRIIRKNWLLEKEKKKLSIAHDELWAKEELFRTVFEQAPIGVCIADENKKIIDMNSMYEMILGRSKAEAKDLGWEAFTHPEDVPKDLEYFERFTAGKIKNYTLEKRYIRPDGSVVWVRLVVAPVWLQSKGRKHHLILVEDITESKRRENHILYLYSHDTLTDLYNRSYFTDAKTKYDSPDCLPLSIIIGDLNGIRLINEAFGNAEGDRLIAETAKILKRLGRDGDLIARTGGDDFTMILPKTDETAALGLIKQIEAASESYNHGIEDDACIISLSLGCATRNNMDTTFEETSKQAEDNMRRHKLLESRSLHSSVLASIKATMFERSQETEEHAERLAELSHKLGIKLGLAQTELDDLKLLATLHDIGKVGIDDRILKKKGGLTEEEWEEMKKHPEIGYRIAASSPELVAIADYILCHHERWDGQGYPQGLKGEAIPILSRIIAIVDTYDAITQDRLYRKGVLDEEAVREIQQHAGSQFDPRIAAAFVNLVMEESQVLWPYQ